MWWVEHQHIQCVLCCSHWGCVDTCHIFYVITIAASRWERRSVGDQGVPLLYYSLCFYYADTYQVLSAFMLFTASRRGWRRVGDQCDPSCIILCVIIIWNLLWFCCLQHLDEDEEEDEWGTHVSPPSTFTKVLVSVSTG